MKKKKRLALIIISTVVASLLLAVAIPFSIYGVNISSIILAYIVLYLAFVVTF